jgi:methyl-accepting chemotaxis protein
MLVIVLLTLGVVQLAAGGFFLRVLNHDKTGFLVAQTSNQNIAAFTDAWIMLNQARITTGSVMEGMLTGNADMDTTHALIKQAQSYLSTADNSYKKYKSIHTTPGLDENLSQKLEKNYTAFYELQKGMLDAIAAGHVGEAVKLGANAPELNSNMIDTYLEWRTAQSKLSDRGVKENQSAFTSGFWGLGSIMVLVVVIIGLSWSLLRRILLNPLHRVISHIKSITSGDLTQDITANGHNEMGQLASGLKEMQHSLISTVSAVRDSTDSIYTGTGEISAGSNDLSSRTEQQAAALAETAASMEQLTATVKQNTDNARQAAVLAKTASETAVRGGRIVEHVVHTMSDITDSSQQIANITSVIDGIAFQTNILALNAAVEAARAGEQGRGFAVVAGAVRNLAQRSAQAAKEIKSLIENSATRVSTGSDYVRQAGETMQQIISAVTHMTDIMSEIASASDEQSRGIEQVAQAVSEMDSVTQQNAALVEESATAASELEIQAGHLRQAVEVFQLGNVHLNIAKQPRVKTAGKAVGPVDRPASLATPHSANNWETF